MVTRSARLLLLAGSLVLVGCSYDWDAASDGTAGDGPTQPNAPSVPGDEDTKADDGGGEDDGPGGGGPAGSPGAYCRALATRFCDDFDGSPLDALWDDVKTRQSASLTVVDAVGAPSGGKVLLASTSQANNPGEATATRSLALSGQPLEVTFWVNKEATSASKPADALTLVVSHGAGSTQLIRWTLGADGSSSWTLYENGTNVHSGPAGDVPTGQWIPVALTMDGTSATLSVGGVPVTQPLGTSWNPQHSILTLGLSNLANQGGGWKVKFDNVTLQ